ncbi:MAG TPA: Uma2 family endonuclease [Thermoanaerobaculia bacterium]|nr:Uma2 family endonuclease [Thermoanaerobaculia bacterium]
MRTASGKKLLTSAEYEGLVEQGVLHEDDRVELIEGEVIPLSPIGPPHGGVVICLANVLIPLLAGRAVVGVQTSTRLSDITEPQPDLLILRPRGDFYTTAHPLPEDIFCLIEVSDSSLAYDRGRKAPLYAQAGVPETWLFNLPEEFLEVYREPGPRGYASVTTLRRCDRVAFAAFPDLVIEVSDLLPLLPLLPQLQ